MTTRPISALTVFAALPVSDLDRAVDWYGRLLGREPDQLPGPTVADWYLAPNGDPKDGTLQLIVDADRAGGGLATINVADVGLVLGHLAAIDVEAEVVELQVAAESASTVRIASITDPEGNLVNIVEARA